MKVPRPSGGSRQSNGVGKIYVKYDNHESAAKALRALAGRKFADRTVVVTFFGEVCSFLILCSSRGLVLIRSFRNTLTLAHGRSQQSDSYWAILRQLRSESFGHACEKQEFYCTLGASEAGTIA